MQGRLSRLEKLRYGVADVGGTLGFVTLNTWFLYFLINVAALPPLLAGAVFVVGRLFDAVTDPVMGALSDRWAPRLGRLAFLRWGALPLGISFALVWLSPATSPALGFAYALAAFLLFSLIYTVVQVPYMALTPELAPEYDARTDLSSYRIAFSVLASLVAVALPPVIITSGPGELAASPPQGWLLMGSIFGAVCALAYLVAGFGVREPARRAPSRRAPLRLEYRAAFGIFGFRTVFALFIVITIGIMVLNSVLPFYLESALRLSAAEQSLALGLLFGAAILAFPVWSFAAARLGKRLSLALGLGLLAAGLLAVVALAEPGGITWRLLAPLLASGVGLSAVMLFPWAMLPDVVEFGELREGVRREGLVYAIFTFGQKLAGSVGVFANAIVTDLFGYQAGAAAQSPETVAALEVMTGPVAAAILVLALILALRFPITRALHEQARARLRELRAEEPAW